MELPALHHGVPLTVLGPLGSGPSCHRGWVYLTRQGITELLLGALNIVLVPRGYAIRAVRVRDARQPVARADVNGRVEHYGVFERQDIAAPLT